MWPFTFFPRVGAGLAAPLGHLDALAVEDRDLRLGLPLGPADLPPQPGVAPLPGAAEPPGAVVVVDRRPGREVVWQVLPAAAGPGLVEDRVGDLPHVGCAEPPARTGLRQQRLEHRPVGVRQIICLGLPFHPRRLDADSP